MTKLKKNKMKTHKGTKKVLNVRQSGSISKSRQGVLHNTGKILIFSRGEYSIVIRIFPIVFCYLSAAYYRLFM